MDENELNKRLKDVKRYIGSFAVDELSQIKFHDYPCFLIINMDCRNWKGSHWIALAIYPQNLYICDSLGGIKPTENISQELIDFLKNISQFRKVCLTKQLQSLSSSLCAEYCIVFVEEMSRRHSFKKFLDYFSENFEDNDSLVQFLTKKTI